MSKQTDFINKHSSAVIASTRGTKLFPSVKMAQMIIESGWGSSANARLANNYFGIKKGVGWNGATIWLNTPRDANPRSEFRKYPSAAASIKDHSDFLIKNKRYTTAGVFDARTPEDQIRALVKGKYAESGNYFNALMDIINQNNLKSLDTQVNKAGFNIKLIIPIVLLIAAGVIYTEELKK
jgi:flagellum-specific peptidoglycan hydrolase FlgJ